MTIRRIGHYWVDDQLVGVASVKGSPGVSTLALGIAAGWPAAGVVLVEADPDGGDLAARFGRHPDPGLLSFVAAVRSGATAHLLRGHAQRLPLDVDAVLAPPGAGASAAVHALALGGAGMLRAAAREASVVVDVGRLVHGGPALAVAGFAADVVLVARPVLEDLTQIQARLGWLREAVGGRLWLALVGSGPYPATEVARDLGMRVLGEVPGDDRHGVGVLTGRLSGRGWQRLRLLRAARGMALALHDAQPRHVVPPVLRGAVTEVAR